MKKNDNPLENGIETYLHRNFLKTIRVGKRGEYSNKQMQRF